MIELFVDYEKVELDAFTFAGGERHIRIKDLGENPNQYEYKAIIVKAQIESSNDIMDLLLLVDAIERHPNATLRHCQRDLLMPYLPYARQDRLMQPGESLAAARFAELINMCNFDTVSCADPHSDVGPSHIKNMVPLGQDELFYALMSEQDVLQGNEGFVLCSPDAGALKKIYKVASIIGYEGDIAVGQKHRNTATGQITGTSFSGADVNGKTVIIVDDICDGGATFTHLGTVLKEAGAAKVILYVTLGIFSKGIDDVFEGSVDEIYTPFPWRKNSEWTNEKGILKTVDMIECLL